MNYFHSTIEANIRDAVKALCEEVPEINEKDHEWEALVKIVEVSFKFPHTHDISCHARYWMMLNGQNVLMNNYDKLSIEDLSFNFYIGMIRASDWHLSKYLIKNMPTKYVEKYLIEELPNIGEIQQYDHFKAISKRKDEWGQCPAAWLERAFGKNRNNG